MSFGMNSSEPSIPFAYLANSEISITDDEPAVVLTAMVNENGISVDVEGLLGLEESIDLNVYPNPFVDQLSIEFKDQAESRSIQVHNLRGQLILEHFDKTNKVDIKFPEAPSGLYILRILIDNELRASRLLIKN